MADVVEGAVDDVEDDEDEQRACVQTVEYPGSGSWAPVRAHNQP